MIAIQPKSRQILGVNQQAYQALKASMSLNLRRQLLIAVCDSATLQEQLATQLEDDLTRERVGIDRFDSSGNGMSSVALDRLVFDPEDAHLPRQVAQWVRQTMLSEGRLPQLQMLGIEQMTRQSASVQNHFLRSLEKVEALLARLNTSLLIWVPWPWLRTIQSSAPTFWRWRSGVFEFVSDPTPTASVWDESLDPDMFEEDLESSARALPFAAMNGSSKNGSSANAFVELTQDDFVGDYAEPNHLLVGLYGESGEGDSPAVMPLADGLDAVEAPVVEEPVEPATAVDAGAESRVNTQLEPIQSEFTEPDAIETEPDAIQTEPEEISDQDFTQGLIESFVQSSSALSDVESLPQITDEPVVDLVIDPLIKALDAVQQAEEAISEPSEITEPSETTADATEIPISETQDTIEESYTEIESQSVLVEALADEAAVAEEPETHSDPETPVEVDIPIVSPATIDSSHAEVTVGEDENVTADIDVTDSDTEKVEQGNEPASSEKGQVEQLDEWNLLAAMTLAFQSNMAEAQRLTAAATKWISNSSKQTGNTDTESVQSLDLEPSDLELSDVEPSDVESLVQPLEPLDESSTAPLSAVAESLDSSFEAESTPLLDHSSADPLLVLASETASETALETDALNLDKGSDPDAISDAETAMAPGLSTEPDLLVETVILESEDSQPEPIDLELPSSHDSLSTTEDETSIQSDEDALPKSLESDAVEEAPPSIIRVQVAGAMGAAVKTSSGRHPEVLEALDEVSDDLDFSLDLEEDLVISEAESVGLEVPTALPDAALVVPAIPEALPKSQPSQKRSNTDCQAAAAEYFAIGYRYRARIESGERDLALIESAIAAYEGGLSCLSDFHADWASGLNDLGTLYWLKAQQLSDPDQEWDAMTHSISLYQQALTKIDAQQHPEMVCQLYSNMGAVYSILATYQDPTEHLQKAVNVYCQALRKCPLSVDPIEYATLNNSLGSVYWKLSHYEEVPQNLRHAIAAYTQSLRGYDSTNMPLDYASVQNNLGITYWSLSKHESPVISLKNAIAAYYESLKYRTAEVDPAACAVTYNNLALAYWDLSKDKDITDDMRLRYRKNAVTAFEAALNTAEGANSLSEVDSAAIYHCLGDVHTQMAEAFTSLQDIAQSLQKSLHSYVRAIKDLPEDAPAFENRLSAIVSNVRAHYEYLGLASQQSALSRIPPNLLSQVMVAL